MNKQKKIKVLFVCMGNICRSPTAHGVFENMVKNSALAAHIIVDSAGTHAYHVGEKPDGRAQQMALSQGFDLSYIRARKVKDSDFFDFDYILAMDQENYQNLLRICPSDLQHKVSLFLDFAKHDLGSNEVPDPYYGGSKGFENVFNMVHQASIGLLDEITQKLSQSN